MYFTANYLCNLPERTTSSWSAESMVSRKQTVQEQTSVPPRKQVTNHSEEFVRSCGDLMCPQRRCQRRARPRSKPHPLTSARSQGAHGLRIWECQGTPLFKGTGVQARRVCLRSCCNSARTRTYIHSSLQKVTNVPASSVPDTPCCVQ